MQIKYTLPLLAIAGFLFAAYTVITATSLHRLRQPLQNPPPRHLKRLLPVPELSKRNPKYCHRHTLVRDCQDGSG